MANFFKSVLASVGGALQSKRVTAGISDIVVQPDLGYDGLSQVIVEPTPSTDITPSSSGTAFSAGMNNMAASGYAYSSRPSGSMSRTLLWSNSNPSSSFGNEVTVNLSSPILDFAYILFAYKLKTSTDYEYWVYMNASDLRMCETGVTNAPRMSIAGYIESSLYARTIKVPSNTQVIFSHAYKCSSSAYGTSTSYLIPTKIYGCNIST